MKRFAYALVLVGSLTGLTGCDNEVGHTREVKVDGGKVTTKDTTVKEGLDSVTVEKKTTTKDYDDNKTKTETETKTYPKP